MQVLFPICPLIWCVIKYVYHQEKGIYWRIESTEGQNQNTDDSDQQLFFPIFDYSSFPTVIKNSNYFSLEVRLIVFPVETGISEE